MSQQKLDVVQRIYEAWGTGDFEAGVGHLDRDVVLVIPRDFPEFGVFVGLDGVREFMRRFLDQWDHLTIEARQLQAVGDTVLTRIVQRGKGRASGIDVEVSYFQLFTFRGDAIVRMDSVMDEATAREAAGLSE